MGKPARDVFLVLLREAREEWFRRKKRKHRPPASARFSYGLERKQLRATPQ
jgi:hypothetical protein